MNSPILKTIFFSCLAFVITAEAQAASLGKTRQSQIRAREVAEEYCASFVAHDGPALANLYAETQDVVFEDPIFGPLDSAHAKAMWKMLMTAPEQLTVQCQVTRQIGRIVFVSWKADYIFSKTKLPVSNLGETVMKIADGKIVQQRDSFDLCHWTLMALGDKQGVYCANPEKTIRAQMLGALANYMKANP